MKRYTRKFKQGVFIPKNTKKYIHSVNGLASIQESIKYPKYRSSWEFKFFIWCDQNDNVLQWSSEPIAINYFNPVKNKMSRYFPDVLVNYNNKLLLIEIKPTKQCPGEKTKSTKNKIDQLINEYKWDAAKKYCSEHDMTFIVLNDDFFINKKINLMR